MKVSFAPFTGPRSLSTFGIKSEADARARSAADRPEMRRWVLRRDRWTMSATPRDEDRSRRRERRTRRAGGEEAYWFWRGISKSSVDRHTVRVGLVRRLKAVCGSFGPRVVS